MYTLLLPLLLLAVPAVAKTAGPELCQEIRTVLAEQVEMGLIKEHEVDAILGRCAEREE